MKRIARILAMMFVTTIGSLGVRAQTPDAWWKAEGNANDSAGTNNGIVKSSFSFVPGHSGQAFSFAGGTISVADATNLDSTTNLTVQMWVKGGHPDAFQYLLTKTGAPAGASYAFYTGGDSGLHFWIDVPGDTGNSGLLISSGPDPAAIWDNNWHQVTGVYDGSAVHLYMDGAEIGSGIPTTTSPPTNGISYSPAGPLVLGNFSVGGGSAWSGDMDDLKIFSRAFSADDVMDTFTNASSVAGTNDLSSWWRADGNALDSWGSNNGTINAATISYFPGESGQAFLSGGGAIIVSNAPALEPANAISVQAWVKSIQPGNYKYILSKSRLPGFGSYALYTGGSGQMIFFVSVGPSGSGTLTLSPAADAGTIYDGAWHQVTGVYDGSAVHLYVDGLEVGSGTPASGPIDYVDTNQNNGALVIANDPTYSFNLPGGIDEVKIWDSALTAQQVAQSYGADRGLVSWWRAEEDATDSVGTNNGAIIGNVTFGPGRLTGTAFKFAGGAVDVPESSTLEPAQMTVEALVSGSPQGQNKYIISKSFSASKASYAFSSGPGGGLVYYVNVNGSVVSSPAVSPSAIWDGNFHFVAGTYDGQSVRLFVDGNEIGSGTPATGSIQYGTGQSGGDLLFGDFSSSLTTSNFVGFLDDVKIYNTALSLQQIQSDSFQAAIITAQPQSAQASTGSTVSLSVSAIPSGVAYQWTFNGTNIPGAVQSSLILTNVQAAQAGSYQVAVMVGEGNYFVTNALLGGEGFHLPGTMVDVPNDPSLAPANQVTVQAWVRNFGSPGNFKYIITKSLTTGAGSYAFWTHGSGGVDFYVYLSNGSLWFSPDAGPTVWDGNWHQLTGTYDGEFTRIYLDGVQVGTGTDGITPGVPINYSSPTVNGDFIIGDFVTSGGNNYGGDIDEVKLFGTALSDADVMTTYTNINSQVGTNGLISWWKGENNTFDSFGQNNGHFLPLPGSVLSQIAVLTIASSKVSFTNASVSGGMFHATVTGSGGTTYVVQRSGDLRNPVWIPIVTNTVPFSFIDPIGSSNAYYRAVAQ